MFTLYGHSSHTAANILKIRIALAEVGAEYHYQVVDLAGGEQHKPAYQAVNPHGKVPCLVDEGFSLPESDAILWYVAEKFPKAGLVPVDIRERARVNQWCNFASTSLYVASYELFIHTTQAEPENRSAWVRSRAQANLDRALAVLDKHLAGREWVATSNFTIADASVASVLHMIRTREQLLPGKYANTDAFYDRVTRRPSWAKATASTP
jgi:glutathione S-transferase